MQANHSLYPEIVKTIQQLSVQSISQNRALVLQPLIDYIQQKVDSNHDIRLHFICTHNSRRSHLAQVWAQTMAHYFGVKHVICYSGGTEVTAVYPLIIETLSNSGFRINKLSTGSNSVISIKYAKNELPVIGFSKVITDKFNPTGEFAAIMTCSQADDDCPFVNGAEQRMSIPYEDPKSSDGTPKQAEIYNERSNQIAKEFYYVFSKINC